MTSYISTSTIQKIDFPFFYFKYDKNFVIFELFISNTKVLSIWLFQLSLLVGLIESMHIDH